jgi:acetylornithine deacetylase/succinyl-diaminopimelate desuccinylase-like protein
MADRAPLCMTGHLDVVPLGTRKWSNDPFAGEAGAIEVGEPTSN